METFLRTFPTPQNFSQPMWVDRPCHWAICDNSLCMADTSFRNIINVDSRENYSGGNKWRVNCHILTGKTSMSHGSSIQAASRLCSDTQCHLNWFTCRNVSLSSVRYPGGLQVDEAFHQEPGTEARKTTFCEIKFSKKTEAGQTGVLVTFDHFKNCEEQYSQLKSTRHKLKFFIP